MTDDRSLERAARSWLEEGPARAPDRPVDAALALIQTTAQERDLRIPWRVTTMSLIARVGGVAVLAALLIGALALVVSPGRNVGTTRSASPNSESVSPLPVVATAAASSPAARASSLARADLEKDFISARYGYTVSYLPGWTTHYATKAWIAGTENGWNSGYNDELTGSDIRFSGASQHLATGQSEQAWLTSYAGGANQASWRRVQIDGAVGWIDADGLPAAGGTIAPGGQMFDAVVIKDGVAYNFNMDGNVDRASFEAVLSTIRLTPATLKP